MAERLRPPYDVGDGLVCSCILKALPLVEYRFQRAGWVQDFAGQISQWCYRGGATAASAGTHDAGGVLDVRWVLVDSDAKLKVWLECGVIMFPRYTGSFATNKHGHGVLAGCPHVDPSAARQITSYRNGYDGLANPSRYPGPDVPFRTWQRAQIVYAETIKEMLMEPGDVWSYDIDEHGHDARWSLNSTRDAVMRIGPRTQALVDQQEEFATTLASIATNQKAIAAAVAKLAAAQGELRADVADLTTALAAQNQP